MNKLIIRAENLKKLSFFKVIIVLCLIAFTGFSFAFIETKYAEAQITAAKFRVGEKLTYTVSFDRLSDAGFAEIGVVSRGTLGNKDAVELHSKFKTLDFVSAVYYLLDESRTTFASYETGLPLYTSKIQNAGGLPKETIGNYLSVPTSTYDLLTLLFKIRQSNGNGEFPFIENGRSYNVILQSAISEKVKTPAGEFNSEIIAVKSDFLTEIGIKELRINLSSDEARIPVLIRLKTEKGEFKAAISSIQINEPQPIVQETPLPVKTPRPAVIPVPTPTPYIDGQLLSSDLLFQLGESLEYQISAAGRPVAAFNLQAKERKQFLGADSLLLTATVTRSEPGNPIFAVNDFIRANVDPETLAPQQVTLNFAGGLAGYNQTAKFDRQTSRVTFSAADSVEVPVGTHSILSLLYAIRSFNLKPSKDTTNPVNDTRVAVFWENKPYVFTLRPEIADLITQQGEKVSAQLITVKTGNQQLDALNIKIWLSNDERRLPLRISAGGYQADLVSNSTSQIK